MTASVATPVTMPVATQRPAKSLSQTFRDSYRSNYNAIRPKLGPMRKKAQPETKQKLPTQPEVDERFTNPDYSRYAERGIGGGLNQENPNSFETLDYINSSIDNDTLEILKVYFEYIYCLYFQNPNNELLKDLINIVLIQNLELDENEIKTLLNKNTEFNSLHSIYNNIIENTKDSVTLHQRIFGKSKTTSPTLSIPPSITPLAKAPSPESPQPSEPVPDPRLFDPDYGRYGYGGGLIGGSNMNNRWFEAALYAVNGEREKALSINIGNYEKFHIYRLLEMSDRSIQYLNENFERVKRQVEEYRIGQVKKTNTIIITFNNSIDLKHFILPPKIWLP